METDRLSSMTSPVAVYDAPTALERAEIDRSSRLPVLLFFGSATFWLLVGSFLGVLTSLKLYFPGLLDGEVWLTYGRLRPAQLDSIVYGWASAAGIGVGLWLLARLSRRPLANSKLLVGAAIFWNIGVLFGVLGIIAGASTSVPLLEFPGFASAVLFLAYLFIAIWAVLTFLGRKPGELFVSQWFLLAAFLCFPWLYATANLLLVWSPISASAQGAVMAWFTANIFGLWLTPLALASAYYFLPKITGRTMFSHVLNVFAFWSLAFFTAWSGLSQFIGGPFPAWMVSTGAVSSFLLLLPIVAIGTNFYLSMGDHLQAINWSPALRFSAVGVFAFVLAGLQGVVISLPSLNSVLNFTDFLTAHDELGLYGFFSMTIFGGIYYITPRLVGWEWPCVSKILWHFWLSLIGIGLSVVCLLLGGLIQGFALTDPGVTFANSILFAAPFRLMSALGWILFFIANLTFAFHFAQILLKAGLKKGEPTFFQKPYNEGAVV